MYGESSSLIIIFNDICLNGFFGEVNLQESTNIGERSLPNILEIKPDAGVEALDPKVSLVRKELTRHRLVSEVDHLVMTGEEVKLFRSQKSDVEYELVLNTTTVEEKDGELVTRYGDTDQCIDLIFGEFLAKITLSQLANYQ